jgi:hypothetical protein
VTQTEVGTGYVTLIPSARGFAKRLQKDIAREFAASKLDTAIADALGNISIAAPVQLQPQVDAFRREVRRDLDRLTGQTTALIPVTGDTDTLRADVAAAVGTIERQVQADVRTRPAGVGEYEDQLRAFVDGVESSVEADVPTEPDLTGFTEKVRRAVDQAEASTSVEVDVDVDKDVDVTAREAGTRLSSGIISSLTSGLGAAPLLTFGGLLAGAVAVAPLIGAAISTAVIAGAGTGIIGLGALALRDNPAVQQSAAGMVGIINDTLAEAAAPLEEPFIIATDNIAQAFQDIGPDLRAMFESIAPYIPMLAQGVGDFIRAFTPGMVDAVAASGPLLEAIAFNLGPLGEAAARLLTTLSQHGPEAVMFINLIVNLMIIAIDTVGGLVSILTTVFGFLYTSVAESQEAIQAAWGLITGAFERGTQGANDLVNAAIGFIIRTVKGGFDSVRDAVDQRLDDVQALLRGLPGRARSALGDLGGVLWDPGRALISGLINGIMAAVPGLQGTLSWVTSMIPDWKGPLDKDRRLLEPTGEAIMGGLIRSIAGQTPALRDELGSITALIAGTPLAENPALALASATRSVTTTPAAAPQLGWAPGASGDRLLDAIRELIRVQYGGSPDAALGSA